MEVKDVEVGDLSFKEEDFLNAWNQMAQYKHQVNTMLHPALEAIEAYHFSFGGSHILLDNFEYHESSKGKFIMYSIEVHINGNTRDTTFTIPLDVCLAGKKATIKYFEEEKRKQEEKANVAGKARDDADKEERRKKFLELKLEFEPKEDAIVKKSKNDNT